MALYRKYRPATFKQVLGQEHVTTPLIRGLDRGKISHAYLFSGPRGCGKTSSARILARSLNCAEGESSTPCEKCESCVTLAPGGSGNLDVIELDAASHGGVDDTRELRDKAFYAPAASKYRIFIIDEAHMVTGAGFNALLKIVEEPPEHVIFIFATTEPEKVIPTIRSRTHHYPFRLVSPTVMKQIIDNVLKGEKYTLQPGVYPLLIKAGAGSPRDTLSLLDQLISGNNNDNTVTTEYASTILGFTESTFIDAVMLGLGQNNPSIVFETIEKILNSGIEPKRFGNDLLDRIRDLTYLKHIPDAIEKNLVETSIENKENYLNQSNLLGENTLARYGSILSEGLTNMRGATSPRLLLEMLIAKLIIPSDDIESLIQRVEQLEAARPDHHNMVNESKEPPTNAKTFIRPSTKNEVNTTPENVETKKDVTAEPAEQKPASPKDLTPEPPLEEPPKNPQPKTSTTKTPTNLKDEPPLPPEPALAEETPPETTEPEPEKTTPEPKPQTTTDKTPQTSWHLIQAELRRTNRVAATMFTEAQIVNVNGSNIEITHPVKHLLDRLVTDKKTDIEAAINTVLGGSWSFSAGEAVKTKVESKKPVAVKSSSPSIPEHRKTQQETEPKSIVESEPATVEELESEPVEKKSESDAVSMIEANFGAKRVIKDPK